MVVMEVAFKGLGSCGHPSLQLLSSLVKLIIIDPSLGDQAKDRRETGERQAFSGLRVARLPLETTIGDPLETPWRLASLKCAGLPPEIKTQGSDSANLLHHPPMYLLTRTPILIESNFAFQFLQLRFSALRLYPQLYLTCELRPILAEKNHSFRPSFPVRSLFPEALVLWVDPLSRDTIPSLPSDLIVTALMIC